MFLFRSFAAFLLLSAFFCLNTSYKSDHQTDKLPITGTPRLISKDFEFTEGPAVDRDGNIFFTDQPNDKIWEYDINGKLSTFKEKMGRANGLSFDEKGNLLICADENNQLWSLSPSGRVDTLVKNYQGHLLNGPNDVWADGRGGIYFTDPYYKREYWTRKPERQIRENVYYVSASGGQPVLVLDNLKTPNGIAGSADHKYLFVSDIGDNKTYKYQIAPDHTLTDRVLLITQGSDGMTLDDQGNIYLTGKGVNVYDAHGNLIQHLEINEPWTSNVCFGGKRKDELFITASEAAYTVKTRVKGIE